jgi:hypothetical protein
MGSRTSVSPQAETLDRQARGNAAFVPLVRTDTGQGMDSTFLAIAMADYANAPNVRAQLQ